MQFSGVFGGGRKRSHGHTNTTKNNRVTSEATSSSSSGVQQIRKKTMASTDIDDIEDHGDHPELGESDHDDDTGNVSTSGTNQRMKHSSPSTVWMYFKRPDKQDGRAICKLCSGSFSTTGGGTTALRNHLNRKHFAALALKKEGESKASSYSQSDIRIFGSSTNVTKYSANHPRKKGIDLRLALMVARDFQPYSIVNDAGFREIMEYMDPRYQLPCRQTLTNQIVPQIHENCKLAVADIFNNVKYIVLSFDGWSSVAQDAYIGIVGHYIDDNWQMKKVLVDLILITSVSEDAKTIASEVKEACENVGIYNKIVGFITDEASVMISAVVHEMKKAHLPCFAHVLNTIIRNSITKCLQGEVEEETKAFSALFAKNRDIVSFFHRSNKAQRIFDEVQRANLEDGELLKNKFIQMIETRWGTSFQMLQSVKDNHEIAKKVKIQGDYDQLKLLTKEELEETSNIIEILRPYHVATTKFSGDTYVSVSSIIPTTNGIRLYLEKIDKDIKTPLARLFLKRVQAQNSAKLLKYEERSITRKATILDPRYDKRAFVNPDNYEAAKKLIIDAYPTWAKSINVVDDTQGNTDQVPKPAELDLLDYLLPAPTVRSTNQANAVLAFQTYSNLPRPQKDSDVLEYWSVRSADLPVLAEMARGILCIPGSSVSVERLFSLTGYIISDRRSRLLPNHVYELSFIKNNFTFAEEKNMLFG